MRKIIVGLLKLLLVLFIFLIIFIFVDYVRLNISYSFNKSKYIDSIDVQGNKDKYVPQGLAYSEENDIVLQTSYNKSKKVSMLYVTRFSDGKLLKSLKIKNNDNSENTSHVGGIAVSDNKVWITSDYYVNEFSLKEIINTRNDSIRSLRDEKLPIRGDFATYKDNTLWIGDFFLKPFYNVENDNPLLLAYNTNGIINYQKPKLAISLPKMVQGLTFDEENNFILTRSFTNLISSDLVIYKNVLNEETNETYKVGTTIIPYYKFNDENKIRNENLVPMAEGLFYKEKYLYILFENSSDAYFYAYPKLAKIIKYEYK